jgi:hypothetical protein
LGRPRRCSGPESTPTCVAACTLTPIWQAVAAGEVDVLPFAPGYD